MRDILGPGTHLGYCTNVHAGESLDAVRDNLRLYAVAVKNALRLTAPMGVGLWLAAAAAEALSAPRELRRLGEFLEEHGLYVFTLNGFPYGDFQSEVVKHDVYRPNWAARKRLDYTLRLIDILAELLPPGVEGGISTLPVAWPTDLRTGDLDWAAGALREVADHLHDVAAFRKRVIHVDLEPEPGCLLSDSRSALRFFEEHLFSGERPERVRRHLRLCHDVCHAAVEFESQQACFERYAAAGVAVGKVQISAALCGRLTAAQRERAEVREQLSQFAEPRFLHQTRLRRASRGAAEGYDAAFDDLTPALEHVDNSAEAELRSHFHVPIFLKNIGALTTTQADISPALRAARRAGCLLFEVETYAWGVLPPALRVEPVTDGIAEELALVMNLARQEALL